MDWIDALSNINYAAAAVSVLAGFAVGMVWYAPQVFGEVWRKEAGLSKKEMDSQEGMAQIFGTTALFNFTSAIVLASLFTVIGVDTLAEGVVSASVIGVGLVSLTHGVHSLFERKSMIYIWLNAGHNLLTYAVMGAILGAWS